MTSPELHVVDSIRHAAGRVLGDSQASRGIMQLCDQHAEAIRWISDQRVPDATTVGVIGATGQGKSWLIRQLVLDASVQQAIRSGDAQDEATRRLYWIGPRAPAQLDSRYESYLYCPTESMVDLGGPTLLVDTPGATDADDATVQAASRAISMASVLILVVRRQQLRSEVPARLAAASEGTLVLPVVNAIRGPLDDAELRADIDAMVARLRSAAPRGDVLSPVMVPDFEVATLDEKETGRNMSAQIAAALRPHLSVGELSSRRQGLRLQAEHDRFQHQLREQLAVHLPRLSMAVEHLEEATGKLPHEVAVELIGSGQALRAGIRSRLRAEMLVATAAIWFPYRTLLGLLNLTHGAWDRVILALSGSLPSLVGAAWTSVRNLSDPHANGPSASTAIRSRSHALIADRIVPLVHRFRGELARLRPQGAQSSLTDRESSTDTAGVQMLGIDSLLENTQQIFDEEISATAPRPVLSQIFGLLGSFVFWSLMAGPIVTLYRTYLSASYDSISTMATELDRFPHPTATMIFTSLVLSILPTSLFAMLVLTWIQRRGRQELAASRIDARIKASIVQLQSDGVLRLEFHDPLLEDARRLLRASASPNAIR